MSKHNEYTIKDLVEKMLQVYGLDRKLAEQKLISSWESVMGSIIAKHTKDIFINKQQLFVTLDSSALRKELSMAKSKIITMMNQAAGESVINEIVFK
jgi:predicted nucleic acid-binding Zn ribbon protein